MAWQTPAGARPNRRREAVLFDRDAAGRLLENAGDRIPREMTVRSSLNGRLRQNPAYRPRESSPFTMRTRLRRSVIAIAVSCSLLAACGGPSIPNQVLTTPAPVSARAAPARPSGRWPYRPSAARQTFVIDQRAVITIRLDTSTLGDTVSSHTQLTFVVDAATNAVNGNVGEFLVQSGAHAAATPAGLSLPFPFRAEYSARISQFDFTAPQDAAPCTSTSLAVAQSLRDLWFKPPDTLRVGVTWDDSSSYVVCRDGIRLHATVHRNFRVTSTSEKDGRTLLAISRTARTSLEGSGTQFGESINVSGTGSGQLVYDLDPENGEIISAAGGSVLDFSMRGGLHTQTVRQTADIRIGRS